MRVISGSARGTKLYSLDDLSTRPTLDRVKESLFNIINNRVKDAIVLDLFAGSGALGIECASRGAKKIFLCDKSKSAVQIIEKNVDKTKLRDKIVTICQDYQNFIQKNDEKFDLIFIDPPYETNIAIESVKKIIEFNLLNEDGIIIIETNNNQRITKELLDIELDIYDIRKYGKAELVFIKRKG